MLVALDTNILAYALGINDAGRRVRAEGLIAALPDTNVIIPVQVLGELFRVLTGKAGWTRELAHASISKWQAVYALAPSTPATLASALDLAVAHAFPIWDAMILAAASEAGCRLLLSEDMRDGFAWRCVTIVDPLTDSSHPLLARALGA
jgi:predicted nucleic acid-binding protein